MQFNQWNKNISQGIEFTNFKTSLAKKLEKYDNDYDEINIIFDNNLSLEIINQLSYKIKERRKEFDNIGVYRDSGIFLAYNLGQVLKKPVTIIDTEFPYKKNTIEFKPKPIYVEHEKNKMLLVDSVTNSGMRAAIACEACKELNFEVIGVYSLLFNSEKMNPLIFDEIGEIDFNPLMIWNQEVKSKYKPMSYINTKIERKKDTNKVLNYLKDYEKNSINQDFKNKILDFVNNLPKTHFDFRKLTSLLEQVYYSLPEIDSKYAEFNKMIFYQINKNLTKKLKNSYIIKNYNSKNEEFNKQVNEIKKIYENITQISPLHFGEIGVVNYMNLIGQEHKKFLNSLDITNQLLNTGISLVNVLAELN